MTIQDIIGAALASNRPTVFVKGLQTVLPDECVFAGDGTTIVSECPDNCGITFAGLNQQDDHLPTDGVGNVLASPQWIADTYFSSYWQSVSELLPTPLNILIFVQAVNQGDYAEGKILQFTLNRIAGARLVIDGRIGPQTAQAAMSYPDTNGLCKAFLADSKTYYQNVVTNHPSDQKFLDGWDNRIDSLQAEFCT